MLMAVVEQVKTQPLLRRTALLITNVSGKEVVPWLFAAGITAAEILVSLVNVQAGMLAHTFLLLAMLTYASLVWYWDGKQIPVAEDAADGLLVRGTAGYRFYIALAMAPIIRIISLAMPMWNFPVMYWYLITGVPLILTAFAVMRVVGYRSGDVHLAPGNIRSQFGIAATGIVLGTIEFSILRPQSILPGSNPGQLVLAGFILLVFTGFAEEIIFRGVLLKAADDYLGQTHSLVYAAFIFAVLHIIHVSALDILFVFSVAVLFTFFVRRTGSLLGVTIAHGLTNILLYLLWPLLLM